MEQGPRWEGGPHRISRGPHSRRGGGGRAVSASCGAGSAFLPALPAHGPPSRLPYCTPGTLFPLHDGLSRAPPVPRTLRALSRRGAPVRAPAPAVWLFGPRPSTAEPRASAQSVALASSQHGPASSPSWSVWGRRALWSTRSVAVGGSRRPQTSACGGVFPRLGAGDREQQPHHVCATVPEGPRWSRGPGVAITGLSLLTGVPACVKRPCGLCPRPVWAPPVCTARASCRAVTTGLQRSSSLAGP